MKVSAITVCWNSEATLCRALESLRAQTYRDIQLVVVDGGSSDNTVRLARAFAHDGDVVVSERDGGIYNAMNKGLSLASGDLVYFLNSDDRLYEPSVISEMVFAAQLSSAEILVGDVIVRGGDEAPYRKSHSHIRGWNLIEERICHQAAFVRRSVFARFGGVDERYRIGADHEFFIRAIRGGAKLLHVPKIVAEFQRGGASSPIDGVERTEGADIYRRYHRGRDVPLLLAYRTVRKAYRAIHGHWIDHRSYG